MNKADLDFIERLKVFCLTAGYEICGTNDCEGIYGEITGAKIGSFTGWDNWDENKFNFEIAGEQRTT